MKFWLGLILVTLGMYMNYANVVLFNPLYSFAVQQSFSILGSAMITHSWIFRKLRGRKK